MKKNTEKNNFDFWRKLINAWSFFFFAIIIIDFIYLNAYKGVINAVATVYVSILALYVSNKEFERWYDNHKESHPGEVFVLVWSVLVGVLFILDMAYGEAYELSGAVISTYIAVLTILVITRKSKELYKIKKQERRQ